MWHRVCKVACSRILNIHSVLTIRNARVLMVLPATMGECAQWRGKELVMDECRLSIGVSHYAKESARFEPRFIPAYPALASSMPLLSTQRDLCMRKYVGFGTLAAPCHGVHCPIVSQVTAYPRLWSESRDTFLAEPEITWNIKDLASRASTLDPSQDVTQVAEITRVEGLRSGQVAPCRILRAAKPRLGHIGYAP